MQSIDKQQHAQWFRDSSPYIKAHRGKTFVVYLPGEAIDHQNLKNIIKDLVLLNSLGIRLVVVHGATPQINRHCVEQQLETHYHANVRITEPELLPHIQGVIGKIRIDLEAALSKGVVNAPEGGNELLVSSGNFITAKPKGTVAGLDYHQTGHVRKVNIQAINNQLDNDAIVLISPLAYSPSGEIFNIHSAEVASELASALLADKLILFSLDKGISNSSNELINELETSDIDDEQLLAYSPLYFAKQACLKGVRRCHLISYAEDGALLQELFTRDGAGTQLAQHSYEKVHTATTADVAGIIELIQPLEEQGLLVKRSRELIEAEIDRFTVISRDGMVVSCAALYPFDDAGELACLATHPMYRNSNRGEILLRAIVGKAKDLGLKHLFVLTTQSAHWFTERDFKEVAIDELPKQKQSLYNFQRNSKLFKKALISSTSTKE